jgi:thiol-disulfide isomerase/thioredoxin
MLALMLGGLAALSIAVAAVAQPTGSATGPARTPPVLAATGSHAPLPSPPGWDATLRESARSGKPIVIMFSRPDCPHCLALRLESMRHLRADDARRGILVYELDITDDRPLVAESPTSPQSIARSMAIRLVPTVAFLGPEGELAERLVGYGSRDFYNAYLEDRIDRSQAQMRRR